MLMKRKGCCIAVVSAVLLLLAVNEKTQIHHTDTQVALGILCGYQKAYLAHSTSFYPLFHSLELPSTSLVLQLNLGESFRAH